MLIAKLIKSFYRLWVRSFIPVDKNLIVFYSRPDYSDNPRAVSDYILSHKEYEKYKVFWIFSGNVYVGEKNEKLRYISTNKRSLSSILLKIKVENTAGYLLSSHGIPIPHEDKRENQQFIMLWHGCGYKDKGGSADGMRTFDKACVPGPLFVESKSKFWNTTPEYLISEGYPRYDWMLNPSERAKDYMSHLSKGYKKVVIWMPTFRNSKIMKNYYLEESITQFPLMKDQNSWNELNACCKSEEILLVVKLHDSQKEYDIDFSLLSNIKTLNNRDFNSANIYMYEFLALTDALISDYSSVAFDYLVVDKPIAFALDDFELYKNTRGFIFEDPLKYMPGNHLYNMDDLKSFMHSIAVNQDGYKAQRNDIKTIAITQHKDYTKALLDKLGIKENC